MIFFFGSAENVLEGWPCRVVCVKAGGIQGVVEDLATGDKALKPMGELIDFYKVYTHHIDWCYWHVYSSPEWITALFFLVSSSYASSFYKGVHLYGDPKSIRGRPGLGYHTIMMQAAALFAESLTAHQLEVWRGGTSGIGATTPYEAQVKLLVVAFDSFITTLSCMPWGTLLSIT